jgi:multiple sugar transport system substrate-binding protein
LAKEKLFRGARALAVAALLLLALAACQRAPGKAAAVVAAVVPTTITALVWAPDWPDEMQQVAAEFTRLNPDVHVDVQFMTGNSVEENIKPRVAAHTLPDLMSVNPNAWSATLAERGVLTDVGHTAAWGKMLASLKSDWMTVDGKRFGIAGGVAAPVMYYNKEMFAKAGIAHLPTSFREFLAVCERLKKAGFTPIVWNGGFPNVLGNGPPARWTWRRRPGPTSSPRSCWWRGAATPSRACCAPATTKASRCLARARRRWPSTAPGRPGA